MRELMLFLIALHLASIALDIRKIANNQIQANTVACNKLQENE